jgi:hypothetical protein
VDAILKSWKTTCLGIAALGMTVLLIMGKITPSGYMETLGAIAGGGFIFAKDAGDPKK